MQFRNNNCNYNWHTIITSRNLGNPISIFKYETHVFKDTVNFPYYARFLIPDDQFCFSCDKLDQKKVDQTTQWFFPNIKWVIMTLRYFTQLVSHHVFGISWNRNWYKTFWWNINGNRTLLTIPKCHFFHIDLKYEFKATKYCYIIVKLFIVNLSELEPLNIKQILI